MLLLKDYFKLTTYIYRRFIIYQSIRKMRVVPIPANEDNYQYLIIDENTNKAAIVDPVDVDSILVNVKNEKCVLTAALVTHHHWDHASGTKQLIDFTSPSSPLIYAGDNKRIAAVSQVVKDGDLFQIGSLKVHALSTPCHTSTHICYFVEDNFNNQKSVFTGDTLFIAGCGRFFEGTADQMHIALNHKLANLPDETSVYCGHEYTVNNLKFAKSLEPNNSMVNSKLAWAEEEVKLKRFTVPSTIGIEKLINPFMRVNEPSIQSLVDSKNAIEAMQKLRYLKDNFRA